MRQSGKWGVVAVVVLTVAVVIMVSGLLAKGRVDDARESIVALEDSLALRDSVVAVYRSQNVRDSTLLAQRDSAVAADTVAWRQEREALVVRAETADSRATSRARARAARVRAGPNHPPPDFRRVLVAAATQRRRL